MTTLPPMTWLELDVPTAGRWTWASSVTWPQPLGASGVGRWEPELDELLGDTPPPQTRRSRGEERLLDALAEILRAPDYCGYVVRAEYGREGPSETYYAGVARGDDAVVLVAAPDSLQVARVHPTMIAAAVSAQLPELRAAPVTRVELPAQTAALLESGFARGTTPERTLRSALTSAGIPAAAAERMFADPASVRASGMVGAARYGTAENDPAVGTSTRGASWTEMPDGGMISSRTRSGEIVWEPLTVAAVARAIADALSGLGT